ITCSISRIRLGYRPTWLQPPRRSGARSPLRTDLPLGKSVLSTRVLQEKEARRHPSDLPASLSLPVILVSHGRSAAQANFATKNESRPQPAALHTSGAPPARV